MEPIKNIRIQKIKEKHLKFKFFFNPTKLQRLFYLHFDNKFIHIHVVNWHNSVIIYGCRTLLIHHKLNLKAFYLNKMNFM